MSVDDLVYKLADLQICELAEPAPLQITKNKNILVDMMKASNTKLFSTWDFYDNTVFKLITLEPHSSEYSEINTLFRNSMKRGFTVCNIKRVENPFLFLQYCLRKMKKGYCVERKLFHGTSDSCIESICKHNFNWRLAGTKVGNKYGKGISFSPESTYSSHYPRNCFTKPRVMFVVDVLTKSSCVGNSGMQIPISGCDTSSKPNGKVIVKYDDNEFYPTHIIYYS